MENNDKYDTIVIETMTTAGHLLNIIDALQDEASDAAWARTAVKRDLDKAIKALTSAYGGIIETVRRYRNR